MLSHTRGCAERWSHESDHFWCHEFFAPSLILLEILVGSIYLVPTLVRLVEMIIGDEFYFYYLVVSFLLLGGASLHWALSLCIAVMERLYEKRVFEERFPLLLRTQRLFYFDAHVTLAMASFMFVPVSVLRIRQFGCSLVFFVFFLSDLVVHFHHLSPLSWPLLAVTITAGAPFTSCSVDESIIEEGEKHEQDPGSLYVLDCELTGASLWGWRAWVTGVAFFFAVFLVCLPGVCSCCCFLADTRPGHCGGGLTSVLLVPTALLLVGIFPLPALLVAAPLLRLNCTTHPADILLRVLCEGNPIATRLLKIREKGVAHWSIWWDSAGERLPSTHETETCTLNENRAMERLNLYHDSQQALGFVGHNSNRAHQNAMITTTTTTIITSHLRQPTTPIRQRDQTPESSRRIIEHYSKNKTKALRVQQQQRRRSDSIDDIPIAPVVSGTSLDAISEVSGHPVVAELSSPRVDNL